MLGAWQVGQVHKPPAPRHQPSKTPLHHQITVCASTDRLPFFFRERLVLAGGNPYPERSGCGSIKSSKCRLLTIPGTTRNSYISKHCRTWCDPFKTFAISVFKHTM